MKFRGEFEELVPRTEAYAQPLDICGVQRVEGVFGTPVPRLEVGSDAPRPPLSAMHFFIHPSRKWR